MRATSLSSFDPLALVFRTKTNRNLPYKPGGGGHNNIPVQPHYDRMLPSRGGRGCLSGLVLFIVLVIAVVLASANFFAPWWVESQIEHYTPFSNHAFAGTINITKTGTNNTSQLLVSTPAAAGKMRADPPYLLHCKKWRLHADIITTASWMNMQSHIWYQLTYIEGSQCYDQHGKAESHVDINLIGSNDSFGENVHQGEGFGMASAKDIVSNFILIDSKTYNVIVSQAALLLTATN